MPTDVSAIPDVLVKRNPGAQLAIALTVFSLLLCINSLFNVAWLTSSAEIGAIDLETNIGLLGTHTESCIGDVCEITSEDFTEAPPQDEFKTAGMAAIAILCFSLLIMTGAMFFHMKKLISGKGKLGEMLSTGGAALVGIGLITWYLLLPEIENTNPDLGQGFWMAGFSGVFLLGAGGSNCFQSFIDGPPRMRARGIRFGNETPELVLKESSCGDTTLSIIVDKELVRVVRVNRIGASASTTDLLATKRNAYTGFSHQRFDFLDDLKGLFWVLSGASLLSCIMISWLFAIVFTPAIILATLQLMDPERFTISTTSGNHSFMINRWRSNRELTDLAMDLVDEQMLSVLRGEDLETSILENRAEAIALRFIANREDSKLNSAQPLEEAHTTSVVEQTPIANLPPPAPPAEFADRVTQPLSQSSVAEQPPVTETHVEEETPETVPSQELPPPPPLEPAEAPPGPPAAMPTPPAAMPPPPAAMPPPPTAMPPPPAAMPPPPAAIPPPPVMPGVQNAPPAAMPTPPPPPGAVGLTMPPAPAAIPPAPVVVQGAPREENLTSDEKENILGDLRD